MAKTLEIEKEIMSFLNKNTYYLLSNKQNYHMKKALFDKFIENSKIKCTKEYFYHLITTWLIRRKYDEFYKRKS